MSKKPLPRIITGAVITTIAAAAVLTFTRGEVPNPDTASALLPGVSGTSGPSVAGSTATPSSPASADAAERNAKAAVADPSKAPSGTSANGGDTTKPPSSTPPGNTPAPTQAPAPAPSPTQTSNNGLGGLLGDLLGGGND